MGDNTLSLRNDTLTKKEDAIGMMEINDRSVEAVAALLYNLIYDQDDYTPGSAWTKETPRNEPGYLDFAEALLRAIDADPLADDAVTIQRAKGTVERWNRSLGWNTIVIDQTYSTLTQEAAKHIGGFREFLENPYLVHEYEFLEEREGFQRRRL